MVYGRVPQPIIDDYQITVHKQLDMFDMLFEPLQKSLKNSIPKYNKTKDPASAASVTLMRRLVAEKGINIHPGLAELIDEKEEALIGFKNELSSFKPK